MADKEIWSHSRLKARQQCPMSEHLRYEKKLVSTRRFVHLDIGSAIHKGLETRSIEAALKTFEGIYPDNQSEADELEIAKATVEAALEVYFEVYPDNWLDHRPEMKFELPVLTLKGQKSKKHLLAGKIDDIVWDENGNRWLVEYKTATYLDGGYFDRLVIDGQISMYCYALNRMGFPVSGVIYRVIRKPSIKPRKDSRTGMKETITQYTERLKTDYRERPDFYFVERKLYRSLTDLGAFEKELWQQIKLADSQHREGINIRHTSHCNHYGTCRYLPICSGDPNAELLYTTREPHEELKDEESTE